MTGEAAPESADGQGNDRKNTVIIRLLSHLQKKSYMMAPAKKPAIQEQGG